MQQLFRRYALRDRVAASPLAPDVDALESYFLERGHLRSQVRRYMLAVAHVVWCLDTGLFPLESVSGDALRAFAVRHASRCSCPPPNGRARNFVSAARHLGALLERRHFPDRKRPQPPTSPLTPLLSGFALHLREVRGLRKSCWTQQVHSVEEMLGKLDVAKEADVVRIPIPALRAMVATLASQHSPRTVSTRMAAFRNLLRFLALRGLDTRRLADAVPRIRSVRLTTLPRGISDDDLQRLFASLNLSRPIGLRAMAIIRCALDLGLRAGEIAALRFADVDWRAGTITLRTTSTKTRRDYVLPLPRATGQAIVQYLRRGRPRTPCDRLFVRHYMPTGEAIAPSVVTTTVHRALTRAGVKVPLMGAHTLRHTLAGRLVRAGVGFKAIADVMRHRDIDTTRVYARVDWPGLSGVALPWPGTP